ncbi:MAG TPA: hypothetical protein VMT02_01495 [Burkholderiales bacterium]|jgi:hypothetical protein|nr:hypothetical protein [Burkholderiales bacterium]
MYPWLWFWAPQVHFPWSGAVAQNIEPNTSWFSSLIKPEAGNAEIERRAFEVASYGRQLGLITEVLLGMADEAKALSPEAAKSLERLREIQASIEAIKSSEYGSAAARLTQEVKALRDRGGPEYEQVSQSLLPLLTKPPR